MIVHPERVKAIDADRNREMIYACVPAQEAPLDTTVRLAREAEAREASEAPEACAVTS
jgi:hypothetical protein